MIDPAATTSPSEHLSDNEVIDQRFAAALAQLRSRTDRFLSRLMVGQWLAMIGLALAISPQTWAGRISTTHIHVWAAIFLGGAISLYPAWLGWRRPGETATRHTLAVGQMLASALLIHLTGGRIETHFHVFGSLALLALYRDVRVFATATIVVYIDHLWRGIFWPESVYGVFSATVWRSLEHAGWVLFEVLFLSLSARLGLSEMRELVARQVGLEAINRGKEQEVRDRTAELTASEEQFRTFFRDSPIGLYRSSPSGEFLIANPALLGLLGFGTPEDLQMAAAATSQSLVDADRAQYLAQLAATNGVLQRHATWRRRDGTPVQIRESGRAIRDAADRIVRIDGSIEDITQHRQLEERFQQAQKVQAIGQLAGGVAHDFNNILTVINGYSELLLGRPNLSEDDHRSLTNVRDAGLRAASLTRQLLAYSRKQLMQPRIIHLNAVTAEMDPMLQRLVGENIRIRTIATSGLAAVKADPGQIQQVIMNLVVNARDAMPGGGQLTIETANTTLGDDYVRTHPDVVPGPYVMLAVSDTGCGMTADVQARLFEPFFTTKAPGYGTGLGLATCHGIVRQSGGHIVAYSEVGHGTTFKVYLPSVGTRPSATAAEPAAPGQRGAGELILLVEDDAAVCRYGCEVLKGLGYRVISAANGLDGLRQFKEHSRVDLLITDIIMPNMGGRKLVELIRELAPQLPVLYTSGYTYDALGESDGFAPGCTFLAKPYNPAQLGEKVHACLQGWVVPETVGENHQRSGP
jgi:PAS domain S-box-containing protein